MTATSEALTDVREYMLALRKNRTEFTVHPDDIEAQAQSIAWQHGYCLDQLYIERDRFMFGSRSYSWDAESMRAVMRRALEIAARQRQ